MNRERYMEINRSIELKWDPSTDKIGRKKRMGSQIKEVARCTNEEELCQVRERKKSGSFEHMLKDCSMYGESRPGIKTQANHEHRRGCKKIPLFRTKRNENSYF